MLRLKFDGSANLTGCDGVSGTAEIDFPTQKARALFVYLGLTQGHQHSRRALSALFWPDAPESAATNSLRQTLHRIRTLLSDAGIESAMLDTSTQRVALLAHPNVTIDCLVVQQVWKQCQGHAHRGIDNCTICARRMAQAARLISASPMAAVTLDDAPEFDLWLSAQREHIMDSARQLLHTLATYHANGGEPEPALDYVRQWLMLEPWQEEAHYLAIRLLAAQGKRSAALHQYQQCRAVLHEELGIEPDRRIQQLREQIVADEVVRALGSVQPPQVHHAHLGATSLFGRQAEWELIEEVLNDPTHRLVTLLGPGGVGKTQLALAVSRVLARLFRDGVWYVSLDAIASEVQFQAELAGALGVALVDGQPLENQILQFLARRNLLILLDGSEHLTHAAPFVARLLQRCPDITLLVTSRRRLELRAERVLVLDGLPVPTTLVGRSVDADDSLAHFAHAAQRVEPTFTLTEANQAAVHEICRLLEGLPLAVELTAAQIASYTCQELARELSHSLDVATANWIDAPPRQRSLRASFDASWRHLSAQQQQLLSGLAVADSSFSQGMAESIAATAVAAADAPAPIDDNLQRLVYSSLLRRMTNGRFSMHAAVRAFALEHLAADDPHTPNRLRACRTAHLAYFAGWLDTHDPAHAGEAQKEWLDQIEVESGNWTAAWEWAVADQNWAALDRMAVAIHAFSMIRGRHEEFTHLAEHAIGALKSQASLGLQPQCYETLARLYLAVGLTACQMSNFELARQDADEAARCLALIDKVQAPLRIVFEATYWYLQCVLAFHQSHWSMMAMAAQQGLALLPRGTDDRLRGLLLGRAGMADQGQGHYPAAIRTYEEAIPLLGGSDGDHWQAARHRSNLAANLLLSGQDQAAERLWQECYAYFHRIGDPVGAAFTLDNLGYIEVAVHANPQAATALCLQSLQLLRRTGLPALEAGALCSLGEIALMTDDLSSAYEHLAASLRIAVEYNLAGELISTGAWLAVTLLRLGRQCTPAARYLRAALGTPLLEHEIRRRLQAASSQLPQWTENEGSADAVGGSEQFDWVHAAAALAAGDERLHSSFCPMCERSYSDKINAITGAVR